MQFISGNPSFRCGRLAKCPGSVHMDGIIDCSSSLETHHSAADVLQNAHLKSAWDLKGCLIAFCSPQGWFQGGPGARFAVADVCLGIQDAARLCQDGLKLDSIFHLELAAWVRNAHRCCTVHQDAIRMVSDLTPTFACCKSWGMDAPQGVGLRVCTN